MVVTGNFRDKAELRTKRRQPLRYSATILVDQAGATRLCSISDISESGARLLMQQAEELPEKFILLLNAKGDARRVCQLVWRDGKALGVRFVRSAGREAS